MEQTSKRLGLKYMEVTDEYIDLFWSGFKDVHTDYEGCNFEDLIWGLKKIGNSNHFSLS